MKSLSLSEIISFGVPCCASTVFRKAYASSSALKASLYGIGYAYFVSRSLITQIILNVVPVRGSLDGGNLVMKLNAIDSHAPLRIIGDCKYP